MVLMKPTARPSGPGEAGFEQINLDLMFGLPGQSAQSAERDIRNALELDPGHISYYQLTLEPNTAFHHAPPALPEEDLIWQIQERGQSLLGQAGYAQYEISAYAKDGRQCRHNLNYWTFGDYLGIGAGAHGKHTLPAGGILRTAKWRHPRDYLSNTSSGKSIHNSWSPTDDELPLEFMMNRLRLQDGFSREQFESRTGLPFSTVAEVIREAVSLGFLSDRSGRIACTHQGRCYLNDLLALFVPG